MRYFALACDYDGTLASHGRVEAATVLALERFRASGRRLVLVTGRRLEELMLAFPRLDLFDHVVAENGALLYRPWSRQERLIGAPPPAKLVQSLQDQGVSPLVVGRSIIATCRPHENAVLGSIRDLGLEMQVIFNKSAVMVLPSGVNKATGLDVALREIGLSPHEVIGVGDAENDHALLSLCECGVAVSGALQTLKDRADLVTSADEGAGVAELTARVAANDLAEIDPRLVRHHLELGRRDDGSAISIPPRGVNLLLAGPSGSGKSSLATAFLELLRERSYEACIIDPEGDYEGLESAIALGDAHHAPSLSEVVHILQDPREDVSINLLGVPLAERPSYFERLLPHILGLRARTGRPHWVLVDEAHHLIPAASPHTSLLSSPRLGEIVFVTVEPNHISRTALEMVDVVIGMGARPAATLATLGATILPAAAAITSLPPDEALVWWRTTDTVEHMTFKPARAVRRRHHRKYAEGNVGMEKSFYFRGPGDHLKLRAQNLLLFVQIAEGVDEATWMHHLHRGDYSAWFRTAIKDLALAAEAERIETMQELTPAESCALIRAAIERRYTLAY